MQNIRCVRGSDNDWETKTSNRWILCDNKSREWWELDEATEIILTFSKRPQNSSSYKYKLTSGDFHLFAEDTNEWFEYGIYTALFEALDKEQDQYGFGYFSVAVVK